MSGRQSTATCVAGALICALLGLGLQWLIVHCRYGGNWTALFCTGSNLRLPPALAAEGIYIFPNSNGYDGQMYHYVAHDPFLRTGIRRFIDDSRVRYRRILLPVTAFLLAFGNQSKIDSAIVAANLLFLFLGAYWIGRYLESLNLPRRWSSLLVFTPAVLISLDRLTVDLTFTALCIGFALYVRLKQPAKAYALLALACLSRDTGFVIAAAACLVLVLDRQFKKAAAFATAVIPAAVWYLYVNVRTPVDPGSHLAQLVPFRGIYQTALDPIAYRLGGSLNAALRGLDRLALLGFLLAVLLAMWLVRHNGFGPVEGAMLLWSCIGLCLPRNFWEDCYSGPRVFTPLLLYVMLRGAPLLRWKSTTPMLLVLPRVALQVLAPLLPALAPLLRR